MKNKFFYFIIATLCLVGLVSCSDDDDTNIKFLSQDEIVNSTTVASFGEILIQVHNATTGPITVKSNNEDIATAVRLDFTQQTEVLLLIKGVKEGKTSVL